MAKKISVVILTHNAPKYVEETLVGVNEVTPKEELRDVEIIVLDNASQEETRSLLGGLKERGYIDKLHFSQENTFFAKGNNMAAEMACEESELLLLLNSDVKIKSADWLAKLIEYKESGGYSAAAYGACGNPKRADGYCLLVDKSLYLKYRLDENFQWWGGVTKLQAQMLNDGHRILALDNHDVIIYHYGGKSGRDFKKIALEQASYQEILDSFDSAPSRVDVRDLAESPSIVREVKKKFRKLLNRIKQI